VVARAQRGPPRQEPAWQHIFVSDDGLGTARHQPNYVFAVGPGKHRRR
jgi:hypothetical protein